MNFSFEQLESEYQRFVPRQLSLPLDLPAKVDPILFQYLMLSPTIYDQVMPLTDAVKDSIMKVVWFKLNGGSQATFEKLKPDPSDQPLVTGKPCGHVFKKGDGVFRCR